jgi:hypothetical protein
MEFNKFSSIENTYRTKEINDIVEGGFNTGRWVVQEKVHGCLDPNTKLETLELGEITIGEIVDKKLSCHVKTYDGNEIVYKKVTHWSIQEDLENWYEIETTDGRILYVTGNHLVFLPKLNCYRKVEELNGNEEFLVD